MNKETPMQRMRKMLTEHGIDWRYGPAGPIESTIFNFKGVEIQFTSLSHGVYCNSILTPEKVIEILMDKTCKMNLIKDYNEDEGYCTDIYFECSECHHYVYINDIEPGFPIRYCPGCGKKIVYD